MAERSAPQASLRWLGVSLMLLLALAAYNHSLPMLVKGFGLAHSRLLEQTVPATLVVDSMPEQSVGLLQQVIPVQVWGRRAFRVHEILVPSLALAVALAILSFFMATQAGRVGAALSQSVRATWPRPSALMLVGLLAGATLGATWGGDWRFPPDMALMPFVLGSFAVAASSMPARPEAGRLLRALDLLNAGRWFWLGFLLVAWPHLDAFPGEATHLPQAASPLTLAEIAAAFILLHLATRAPRQIGLKSVTGDRAELVQRCDRWSALAVQELWVLLPLVAFVLDRYPTLNALERVTPYLLSSVVCALMMKWTLEGHPPRAASLPGRLLGSLFRVATILSLVGFGLVVGAQVWWEHSTAPVPLPLIIIAMGLVRGQPWFSRGAGADFACPLQTTPPALPARQRRPWSRKSRMAAVAAILALGITVREAAREDWSRPVQGDQVDIARAHLEQEFGHRVRLIYANSQALLLESSLNDYQLGLAKSLVSADLPGVPVSSIPVRLWRWEWAGFAFLGLTVAVSLIAIAQVVGCPRLGALECRGLLAALAGIDGAFALGAAWGWFWLDPTPHLAAFVLCTVLGWKSLQLAPRSLESPPDPDRQAPRTASPELQARPEKAAEPELIKEKVPPLHESVKLDVLSLEVGRNLIPLVDPREGAPLLDRVTKVRRHVAMELGMIVPGLRFRDNRQLHPDSYVIKFRGVEVATARVYNGKFLVIGPEERLKTLPGDPTVDPTYSMPAVWIAPEHRLAAEQAGCMIFDAVSVAATQLTEVCRKYLAEMVTLEQINAIMDRAWKDIPVTVEAVSQVHSLLTIRDVYRRLLEERVSVRDVESILNVLVSHRGDVESLVAECRKALRRNICAEYRNSDGVIGCMELDESAERDLLQALRGQDLPEGIASRAVRAMIEGLNCCNERGLAPLLLVHPRLRAPLSRLLVGRFTWYTVLAQDEIPHDQKTEVLGKVSLATD